MAIVEGQLVEVKWHKRRKEYYINKGYRELKHNETFLVKIEDLPKNSNREVLFKCDVCNEKFYRKLNSSNKSKWHFCSKECSRNRSKYSKEFLVEEFNRYFEQNGDYPQQQDMKTEDGYPSYYYYLKTWGNWKTFIDEMGIFEGNGRWLKQDVETLKELYEDSPQDLIKEKLINDFTWSNIQLKARELGLKRKYKTPSKIAYSKDYLIESFYKYKDEFGKYPLLNEFNKTVGYPSASGYKRLWGNYDNFLKEIGVIRQDNEDGWYICDEKVLEEYYAEYPKEEIINKLMIKRTWGTIVKKANALGLKRNLSKVKRIYSDQYLIQCLRDFSSEYGRSPTATEFDNSKKYPGHKNYDKRFGSWNKALEKAGLSNNAHFNVSKKDIIREAINFYKENGRSPYYHELRYSIGLVSNYFGKWSELLKEANLPLNLKEKMFLSSQELVNYIIQYYEEFNRIPSAHNIESHYGVNRNLFTRKLGSFREGLFQAGLIQEYEIEVNYDEYLINNILLLRKLGGMLNRIPSVSEYVEFLEGCSENQYLSRENLSRKLNKTFTEICELYLPLKIKLSEENKFFRNKRDEKCRSYPELLISNLLIDNNLSYMYETPYSEILSTDRNFKFDWVVYKDSKPIPVEYFGYIKSGNEDYEVVKQYCRTKNIKIDLCREQGTPLIKLFPEDIENNFQGLIEKFSYHKIQISP